MWAECPFRFCEGSRFNQRLNVDIRCVVDNIPFYQVVDCVFSIHNIFEKSRTCVDLSVFFYIYYVIIYQKMSAPGGVRFKGH